ncbi:MAG: CDP-archaeol synthase [Gammaproteobacteria bacterium]
MNLLAALLLLVVANGAPVAAWKLLGRHWSFPVDAGLQLADGQRLLGPSKTWRGVGAATIAGAASAALLGLPAATGALTGLLAMTGDLFSSFVKRRLGIPASGMALGLDQIPESVLPVLALRGPLALTWSDVAVLVAAFSITELLLSRMLFLLNLRKQPY